MNDSETPKAKNKGGRPKGTTRAVMAARKAEEMVGKQGFIDADQKRPERRKGTPDEAETYDAELAKRVAHDAQARLELVAAIATRHKIEPKDALNAIRLLHDLDPRSVVLHSEEMQRSILNSIEKAQLVDPEPEEAVEDNVIDLPSSKVG